MSSKKESKQEIKYDPASLGVYQGLQPSIQTGLQNDMQLDPTKSATYNLGLQQAIANAQALGQKRQNVFLANLVARGVNPSSGFVQSQLERIARATDSNQAQASIENFLNYDNLRRQAQAQAMGYRPLQTGATGTEKTSGLGTWLPQVASAGLNFAAGFTPTGMAGTSPYTSAVQSLPLVSDANRQMLAGWAGVTPKWNGTNSGSYFSVFPNQPVINWGGSNNPFLG